MRQDVIDVMKSLKKDKACDPLGWINEIFRMENAGEDLIEITWCTPRKYKFSSRGVHHVTPKSPYMVYTT